MESSASEPQHVATPQVMQLKIHLSKIAKRTESRSRLRGTSKLGDRPAPEPPKLSDSQKQQSQNSSESKTIERYIILSMN